MASLAVFACFLCRQVFTLSPKHFCQPECDTLTALHWDYCPLCKRTMNSDFETQMSGETNASDSDSA